MKPNSEGLWYSDEHKFTLPPIIVLYIYGELKWRQVGCDTEWMSVEDLLDKDWKKIPDPYFDKWGK